MTSEWPTIMRLARNDPEPYKVSWMSFDKFKDWNEIQKFVLPTVIKGTSGNALKWKEVRSIHMIKGSNDIECKYSFKENSLSHVFSCILPMSTRRKQLNVQLAATAVQLRNVYTSRIPISQQKYRDLVGLCTKGVIPDEYHDQYMNLPHGNTRDCLADTDDEEEITDPD